MALGICNQHVVRQGKPKHSSGMSFLQHCNPEMCCPRFLQCPRMHKAWELAFTFLYNLRYPYHNLKNSKALSIEQCNLFNKMNSFHNEFSPFVPTNVIIIIIKTMHMTYMIFSHFLNQRLERILEKNVFVACK